METTLQGLETKLNDINRNIQNNAINTIEDTGFIPTYENFDDNGRLRVTNDNVKSTPKLDYLPIEPTRAEAYDNSTALNKFKEQAKQNGKFYTNPNDNTLRGQFNKNIDTIREAVFNRNRYIDKLAKDSGNTRLTIAGDMTNNAMSEGAFNINNYQTNLKGERIGKGITELFAPARQQGKAAALDDYLFHKSNIERHNQGKGSVG